MKIRKILWNLFKWLFKLALKILIIALWGVLRLVEVFLQHLNSYLKKLPALIK